MKWTAEQEKTIARFMGVHPSTMALEKIPMLERLYKCHTCHIVFDSAAYRLAEEKCPECKTANVEIMCPLDNFTCPHARPTVGIEHCPLCGQPICPKCGTHDVYQISRVTGYMQDVSGWNAGKRQELKDRRHTTNEELMKL